MHVSTHFHNPSNKRRSRDEQAAGWDSLWNTDEDSLWDRGKPSPALVDFIESKPDVIQSSGKTLRALVPVSRAPEAVQL